MDDLDAVVVDGVEQAQRPTAVLQVPRRRGGARTVADGPGAAAQDARLIPIIGDGDTKRILGACRGKDFASLRDEAIIRLLYNTGARLSEVGNLTVAAARVTVS